VFGSNLGRDTSWFDRGNHAFLTISRQLSGICPIKPRSPISKSFLIQLSSSSSRLYSPGTAGVVTKLPHKDRDISRRTSEVDTSLTLCEAQEIVFHAGFPEVSWTGKERWEPSYSVFKCKHVTNVQEGTCNSFLTLQAAKCRVRQDAPKLKTEVVIMCCLVTAVSHVKGGEGW
jgi:hypothetical protein